MIDKGTDLEQITTVTNNFTSSDIMVHAYLMYGFPTQTDLETINSLEVVRQLFEAGIINSGFWHQFAMTAHSPIGLNPKEFKVESILTEDGSFANNDRPHIDYDGAEHEKYSDGLKKSIYNYMHGVGFDIPLREWFDFDSKHPTISKNYIENILDNPPQISLKDNSKVIWTNSIPEIETYSVSKKKKTIAMAKMEFHTKTNFFKIKGRVPEIEIIKEILFICSIKNEKLVQFKEIESLYQSTLNKEIDIFLNSDNFQLLKSNGLLIF